MWEIFQARTSLQHYLQRLILRITSLENIASCNGF